MFSLSMYNHNRIIENATCSHKFNQDLIKCQISSNLTVLEGAIIG